MICYWKLFKRGDFQNDALVREGKEIAENKKTVLVFISVVNFTFMEKTELHRGITAVTVSIRDFKRVFIAAIEL